MTKKMTYVNAIDNAIALFSQGGQVDAEDKETVEKLEALKAQLIKRNSTEHKPTKAQRENETVKNEIVSFLTTQDEGKSATEIGDHFGISNQKASALLTALVNEKRITREVIKRKAYFSVGEAAQYLDREIEV